MQKWEYATLGWHAGRDDRPAYYWRLHDVAGSSQEDLTLNAYVDRLAEAGADGWELVTGMCQPLIEETLYFKRAVT